MKSLRGFASSLSFLSAVPVAVLYQIFFDRGVEALIHWIFAMGFAFSAFAVFDFKVAKWANMLASAATAALSVIFFTQGLSFLIGHERLSNIALNVLGQELERGLCDVFIIWLVILLFVDSKGVTRIFGFISMSIVVAVEIYTILLPGNAPDGLKALYLLAFVWFLFESLKKQNEAA
ncbi:hypothetical protein K1X84_09775 [bacterium]|nr:hypothetical protein [bacterium]